MQEEMAGVTGLEPAASGVTGQRSNQTELHPLRGVHPSGGRPHVIHAPPGVKRSLGAARTASVWASENKGGRTEAAKQEVMNKIV